MYVFMTNNKKAEWKWDQLGDAVYEKIPIVVHSLPQAATFNLLGEKVIHFHLYIFFVVFIIILSMFILGHN